MWKRIKKKFKNIKFNNRNCDVFVYKTRFGFKAILDMEKVVDRWFYFDDFEYQSFDLAMKFLKEGMIILDIGANIGLYTLLFCKKTGLSGKVFAFEPAPEAFFRLKQNVKLNNFKNCKLFNSGISNEAGMSKFYVCEDDAFNSLGNKPMAPILKTIDIPVTTVDEFCQKENIAKVDLIKIDTEGADYLVLKGADGLLTSENSPIVMCEYNRNMDGGYSFKVIDMYNYLTETGYEIYEVNEKGTLIKFDVAISDASEIICLKERHKSMFFFSE